MFVCACVESENSSPSLRAFGYSVSLTGHITDGGCIRMCSDMDCVGCLRVLPDLYPADNLSIFGFAWTGELLNENGWREL